MCMARKASLRVILASLGKQNHILKVKWVVLNRSYVSIIICLRALKCQNVYNVMVCESFVSVEFDLSATRFSWSSN